MTLHFKGISYNFYLKIYLRHYNVSIKVIFCFCAHIRKT